VTARDWGLDSIDSLELIVLLNREFGIVIKDPKEGRKVLVDVNTMVDYIEKTTNKVKFRSLSRIFITGMGVISAIGALIYLKNRKALAAGHCGITKSTSFPSRYAESCPLRKCPFDGGAERKLQISDAGVTRTTLLLTMLWRRPSSMRGSATKHSCLPTRP